MGNAAADLEVVSERTFAADRTGALRSASVFAGVFVAVAAMESANGGYFPNTWGWSTAGFAWAAVIALLLRRERIFDRWSLALVGLLAAFAGWTLLSLAWAPSGAPVFEAERALVYATGAAAVLLVARSRDVPLLLGGVLAAIAVVDVYSLGTRLFPDKLGSVDASAGYRIAAPIGYWNGVGLVSVIAIVLAVAFAAHGGRVVARALAASSLPVVSATLYFTFSRGSLIVLALAVLVMLALDGRRLQLVTGGCLVLAPAALAVWIGSRSAVGTLGASVTAATHDGHRVAAAVIVAAAASAGIAVLLHVLGPRVRVGRSPRRVYGAALAALAAAVVVVALVQAGGPVHAARKAWHSFTGPPIAVPAGTLEGTRLVSLSNSGRIELWKSAAREAGAHPWLGGGAGSYEAWWLAHRHSGARVRDAHSLYMQTLAEVGPFGLALLVLALGVPLAAGIRARRLPLVPAALSAYVAFLVHAGGEWDWQLAGVTLPAIFLGASLVVAARTTHGSSPRRAVRPVAIAVACATAVVAFFIILGNVPLTNAISAADSSRWADSARQARKAIRWLPWSSEPWRLLGEAELAQRNRAAARVALRKAIAKDRQSWQLWFDLAAATDGAASKAALARASRLNPLSTEIAQLGSGTH
ncbi:MAG TPA: O-antigen ligase family protein [Gaiellaceae bacterium]